jgi:BA14K-like protein
MSKLLSSLCASFLTLSVAVSPVVPAGAVEMNIPRPATVQPDNAGLQTVQYRRRAGGVRWHGPRGGGAVWRGPRGVSSARWRHGFGGRAVVRWHGPRGRAVWRGPRGRAVGWHGIGGRPFVRGGVWRGGNFYWHGYRGFRTARPGFRFYNGWWLPPAAFGTAAIVGARPTFYMSNPHAQWCANRFISYRASDNTFQPFNGPRRQCVSPFGG